MIIFQYSRKTQIHRFRKLKKLPSRINKKKSTPKHSDVNFNTKDKHMILRSNTQKRHYLKGNKHRMRANLSTTTEAKIGGLISSMC